MGIRFRKTKKAGPFRFSLTKKGVGWSIGNKYIGYSHGASGRKSLRASIPGTGISYITPIGGKKRKPVARTKPHHTAGTERSTAAMHRKPNHTQARTPAAPATEYTWEEKMSTMRRAVLILQWPVFLFSLLGVIVLIPDLSFILFLVMAAVSCPIPKYRSWIQSIMPHRAVRIIAALAAFLVALLICPDTPVPEGIPDTETTARETTTETVDLLSKSVGVSVDPEPETVGETVDLLSKAPQKETEPETKKPETQPPETKKPETKAPETKAPETKAPVVIVKAETQPPETKAPETKKPETQPPETEPPITITHKDSSLSPELVKALDGVAAFWAPTGNKIHLNPFCRHFQGTVYAGTVEEANSVKDGGWCGTCSKNANENTKSNVNATPKVIADCYSYQDYLNQIPATAFD